MTVLFYRCDGANGLPHPQPVEGGEFRIWRPRDHGLPPWGRWFGRNLLWWGLERLGLFVRKDFSEVTIWRGEQLLHRLIVTPRWYRFPFMTEYDLQLGDLWTDPKARRHGLARAAVVEAVRRFGGKRTRFWYIVRLDNPGSIRLAESCGFRLIGEGKRTQMWGGRAFGRFCLEHSAETTATAK